MTKPKTAKEKLELKIRERDMCLVAERLFYIFPPEDRAFGKGYFHQQTVIVRRRFINSAKNILRDFVITEKDLK